MSEDKPIDASSVVSPKNDVTLEIDVPVLGLLANVANTKEKIPLRTVVCSNDVPMRFPEKLMELLSNESITDIITWLPHGKGFAILKKRRFANEVIPMYFKQSKYISFMRKLKRWGFTKVTTGAEQGAFYHKFFQRDNPLLSMQMTCVANYPEEGNRLSLLAQEEAAANTGIQITPPKPATIHLNRKGQTQTFQVTLEEKDKQKAEEMLMFEKE